VLKTHSSPLPLANSFADHPQVRQREHQEPLAGVLGQYAMEYLAMTELALNYAKRLPDLGTDAGL